MKNRRLITKAALFCCSVVTLCAEEPVLYAQWKCQKCGKHYAAVPQRCDNTLSYDHYDPCDSFIFLYFDSVYRHGVDPNPFQEVEWSLPLQKHREAQNT